MTHRQQQAVQHQLNQRWHNNHQRSLVVATSHRRCCGDVAGCVASTIGGVLHLGGDVSSSAAPPTTGNAHLPNILLYSHSAIERHIPAWLIDCLRTRLYLYSPLMVVGNLHVQGSCQIVSVGANVFVWSVSARLSYDPFLLLELFPLWLPVIELLPQLVVAVWSQTVRSQAVRSQAVRS